MNSSITLLNLRHKELKQFRQQKAVQPSYLQGAANKVTSACVLIVPFVPPQGYSIS